MLSDNLKMFLLLVLPAVALLAAAPEPGSSNNPASRCAGTWQQQNDKTAELKLTVMGDTLTVSDIDNGKVVSEYVCEIGGKDCPMSEPGKKGRVSVWMNGEAGGTPYTGNASNAPPVHNR